MVVRQSVDSASSLGKFSVGTRRAGTTHKAVTTVLGCIFIWSKRGQSSIYQPESRVNSHVWLQESAFPGESRYFEAIHVYNPRLLDLGVLTLYYSSRCSMSILDRRRGSSSWQLVQASKFTGDCHLASNHCCRQILKNLVRSSGDLGPGRLQAPTGPRGGSRAILQSRSLIP